MYVRKTPSHQQAVLQAPHVSATPATQAPRSARLVPQAVTKMTPVPAHAGAAPLASLLPSRVPFLQVIASPVLQANTMMGYFAFSVTMASTRPVQRQSAPTAPQAHTRPMLRASAWTAWPASSRLPQPRRAQLLAPTAQKA